MVHLEKKCHSALNESPSQCNIAVELLNQLYNKLIQLSLVTVTKK